LENIRKKIYQMVHIYEKNTISVIYKYFMSIVIIISMIPLMLKEEILLLKYAEFICLIVFGVDYILRWSTADYKFGVKSMVSFVKYPFRLISIIDFMSIVALLISITGYFDKFEAASVFTVFRIIRIFRYSKSARTILGILKKSRKPLSAVGGLAIGYIVVSAIIIFNVEPESFQTFFDAVYWATVSLTTVGYGDIYPITFLGRIVAMISSFFGIAIVALPAGIVTAEYLNVIKTE